jgi:hypothetical protein
VELLRASVLFDELDCRVEFEGFLSRQIAQFWSEVRDLVGMVLGYQLAVRCASFLERDFWREIEQLDSLCRIPLCWSSLTFGSNRIGLFSVEGHRKVAQRSH